jgi:predicted HNH restriction endonuclease
LCRSNDSLHGHHNNYLDKLVVVWVCASCHRMIHNSLPAF